MLRSKRSSRILTLKVRPGFLRSTTPQLDASPTPDPVESRRKKLQARLAENLADFEARHRHLISSIPRVLQNMTVEEFAVEYDGNIATFLEKATRAKMNEGLSVDIEASTRKRYARLTMDGEKPFR